MLATSATSFGWTAVNHKQAGILAWVIGDVVGNVQKCYCEQSWHCFFYIADGWKVYPMFIEDEDHIQ